VYPLEFKKTASPSMDAAMHFKVVEKLKIPVGQGGIICLTDQFLPLTSNAQAIPVSAL
jgi:hypothetical protein